ncbi:FMN-binding protein [Streptomyces sp. NPDC012510]|uniref:FMN-binding protein n=1 Tax=Streptomyces sp. NPDC012510 TaxID=3364838 RepID=UPI0036E6870B
MKRAIPALVLSAAALVPVWRYAPWTGTTTTVTAGPAPSASASVSAGSTVVTGPTLDTEKGPVQVQATFRGEQITAVKMLQQPNHPQTEAAVPVLIEETLKAQSADIDTVSGATITSTAYRESLQATIDESEKSASSSDSGSVSGSSAADSSASDSSAADSSASGSSAAHSSASGSSGSSAAESSVSKASASVTVVGSTVGTSKGDVQVQVTFKGEKLTTVEMLEQPNHPRTEAAMPVLIRETSPTQGADNDTFSGATITSGGYQVSLQTALQTALDAKG